MPTGRLVRQIKNLYSLVRFQRGLRLLLRAAWLGTGGMILAWGVNAIWGFLPNPLYWLVAGVMLAGPSIVRLLSIPGYHQRWNWQLDRQLDLKEQVSTAWEEAQSPSNNEVAAWLIQDVNTMLPGIFHRVRKRGWFIEGDLLSALIVGLLGGLVLMSISLQPQMDLVGSPPASFGPLPALPEPIQPMPPNERPGGIPENPTPGDDPSGSDAPGQVPSESGDQPGEDMNANREAVNEALRELGSDLSRQAGTFDFGQALQELDLNGSADALEELAEMLDDLSAESLENLAQSLDKAARSLGAAGENDLAEAMDDAAQAIEERNNRSEAMDDLAEALRQLEESRSNAQNPGTAGEGSGTGGSGPNSSEPLSRLPGESGDLSLPLESPTGSDLLTPGKPDGQGDGLASGSLEGAGLPEAGSANSPLLPGSMLWKWRDVVSQYFQR